MTTGARKLHSVGLDYHPEDYLGAWQPGPGKLFVPTLSEAHLGEDVAIRIGILGQTIRATLHGTISVVRRMGRPSLPPGVELTLDRSSLPAARFLALASKGEKLSFRERAPRFLFARPLALVSSTGERREVSTVNVSESGCAVAWSGPPPAAGDVFTAKLRDGLLAPSGQAIVCWSAIEGALLHRVGLRVLAKGRGARAWKELAVEAARSGGREA